MQNKLWRSCSVFVLIIFTASCTIFKERRPASDSTSSLAPLFQDVQLIVSRDPKTIDCKKAYDELYEKLFNIAGVNTYFENADVKTIDDDIKISFETRLGLKAAFKNFSDTTEADSLCLASAQDVFRALRYVEDYLVEWRMERMSSAPAEYTNISGEFPYLLVNPKYAGEFKSYEDLKSGDVILTRGNAYSSAAIARIAQRDYQFSHLSFVYKNPETKELFTSEAHIEIGSVTASISEHINDKAARSVVFRYRDSEQAHQASGKIFERIKKQSETGSNIQYDFSMNQDDDSKLYCSEVISSGFKMLENNISIPKFKSKFTRGMIPFLNTIGVPVNNDNIHSLSVFAPGDIQFDPDFELVAEWRNPRKMEESRMKDFILSKLFEKMETHNYRIDPSFKMDLQARTLWLLRRTPLVKKFIKSKFPLNMSTDQLEIFMALDKIGDVFLKQVELKALDYDRPMTPKEIYLAIDEFIKKDFDLYGRHKKGQNVEKPSFHKLFHP